MQLDPGDAHPNAPCAATEIARRLDVAPAVLTRWIADGMPALADGRLDPFAVVSWITWQRLDECRLLAGRWQAWLRWFTTPADRTSRWSVRRMQDIYLPAPRRLRWWVPEPPELSGQHIVSRRWNEGEACGNHHHLIVRDTSAMTHQWSAEDVIELSPQLAEPLDRPRFEALIEDLAAGFTYAYRRHLPDEAASRTGTCLDIARWCGEELGRQGRRWRLVSGVVAHRQLANVHVWVEVDDGSAGWIPLDPTIPAVARMLGADWRATVPLAVGHRDARRVQVGDASTPPPDGRTDPVTHGCMGAIDAEGDGALACSDWALGECGWSITLVES